MSKVKLKTMKLIKTKIDEGFKTLMSKVKHVLERRRIMEKTTSFKTLMSKVKPDKYILFIPSKSKKVNKKAKKTQKSTSMSK